MKILVVGGSGFIGSNLVEELIKAGHLVGATYFEGDKQLVYEGDVAWHQADARDIDSLKRVFNSYNCIVMCAAITSGSDVIRKTPMVHVHDNVVMNVRSLQAAYEVGIDKFIFISSNTVYPNSKAAMREEDVTGDYFPAYIPVATMKTVSEKLALLYPLLNPKMNTLIIRPGNTYGPRDDFNFATAKVIPSIIRKIVERNKPVEIWGDGEDLKDFIFIRDLVRGIRLALESNSDETVFNIAQGKMVSIKDVIRETLLLEGISDWPLRYDRSKPSMIPVRAIDTTKAERILGFKPEYDLSRGLTETLNWFRENFAHQN